MSNQISTYNFHKSNIRIITSENGVFLYLHILSLKINNHLSSKIRDFWRLAILKL